MSKRYLWVDVETTGLDAKWDYLLEAAFVFTDTDLNIISEHQTLFRPVRNPYEQEPTEQSERYEWKKTWLDRMNPYVLEMHTVNGLISDIVNRWNDNNGLTRPDQHRNVAITEVIRQVDALRNHDILLAGSSVAFDHDVLKNNNMDYTILRQLHYRRLDVSSIKEDLLDTDPELVHAYQNSRKVVSHRAMDDIKESINELRFYREHREVKENV